MTQITCADCAHWDPDYANSGVCRAFRELFPSEVTLEECGIVVKYSDDPGLDCFVVTGPKFSCIKAAPRPIYTEDEDES